MGDLERQAALEDLEHLLGYVPCHSSLHTTCGTCATYPRQWPSHNWNCRSRGASVSSDTHACVNYRERDDHMQERFPEIVRDRAIASELPKSNGWYWRRRREAAQGQPRPDLRLHVGGVVYFIDCGDFTKIGHTCDRIDLRIGGIETHNPFDLALWALVIGPVTLERRFHSKFAHARHRNEWFRLNAKHRADIKRIVLLLGGDLYNGGGDG